MSGINDPRRAPYVRQPGLQVLLDSKPIPGAIEAHWTSTSHFSPDTFSATFAVNADPRYGMAWWDRLDVPSFIDIQVTAGMGSWVSLGIGQIDDLTIMPESGTVSISGRDLGALLLETPTAESFQNQTSSQIVQTIAARHGMTADVSATSTTLVERLYRQDFTRETHNVNSRNTNEWDLLVRSAQQDGFDLYVTQRTIHYKPLPQLTDKPYVVDWDNQTAGSPIPQSNSIGLRMEHKLQIAKPVTVNVRSFHSRNGVAVLGTATSSGARTGGTVNGNVFTQNAKKPKVYNFVRPNLSQVQAQQLATSLLADITKHERQITWHEPATNLITPRNVVRLQGTGTQFDQAYYVDTVTTSISFDGFGMDITAKSHSAATSQAIAGAATD